MNSVKNTLRGWTGKAMVNHNGYDWSITTMKRSDGKISCSAQAGKSNDGNFSFGMFSDPRVHLVSISGRATEKTIKEVHYKGLAKFDELKESGELPTNKTPYQVKVGQIVFTDGYSNDRRRVIFNIEKNQFGTNYHTIELESLAISFDSHLRPFTEKFGIGVYYNEDDLYQGDLDNLIIEAKAKQKKDSERADAEKILNAQVTAAKIEEGKKLVNIPSWAKSVIVASLYEDKSDSMTDYFHTTSVKTIYLAFSKTTRNNMNELVKASKNFDETENFSEQDGYKYTTGHSYLPDYYLGSERWSGWKVQKLSGYRIDLTTKESRNKIYIAAAEGRYLVPEEVKTEVKYTSKGITVRENKEKNGVEIVFSCKPAQETLTELKSKGFRWSKFAKLWYNKLTSENLAFAKSLESNF